MTAEPHPFDHMRDRGIWFHACDLATDKHVDELIATRHLTDDERIADAIEHGVTYGLLSAANGRRLLALIGAEEPADKSKSTKLKCLDHHRALGWIVINGADERACAWLMIHAVENGVITKPAKDEMARLNPAGILAYLGVKSRAPAPYAPKKPKAKALKKAA